MSVFSNPKIKTDASGAPMMQTGQVVKDGKIISEQYQKMFDPKTVAFCWRHPLIIRNLEDRNNPTDRDKKKLDTIRFKNTRTTDKLGVVEMGRTCPKCFNFIKIVLGKTDKPSLETNIDEVSQEITQTNSLG